MNRSQGDPGDSRPTSNYYLRCFINCYFYALSLIPHLGNVIDKDSSIIVSAKPSRIDGRVIEPGIAK